MRYRVDFGPESNVEEFDNLDWLDDYIISHLQYHEDFETVKQEFIDNQVEEIDD